MSSWFRETAIFLFESSLRSRFDNYAGFDGFVQSHSLHIIAVLPFEQVPKKHCPLAGKEVSIELD
jgi:hypothetical protein